MNSSSIFFVIVGVSWLSRSLGTAGAGKGSAWAAMAAAVPIASLMSSPDAVVPRWTNTCPERSHCSPPSRARSSCAAAIAGWLFSVWPANPLTLGVAALLVMGGPVIGIVHVATADTWEDDIDEVEDAPTAVLPAPVAPRCASPAAVLHRQDRRARAFAPGATRRTRRSRSASAHAAPTEYVRRV